MLVLWTKGPLLPQPNACAHIWVQGCKGKCLLHGDHPWPKSLASADLLGLCCTASSWMRACGHPGEPHQRLTRALRKLLCSSAMLPAAAGRQALVTPSSSAHPRPLFLRSFSLSQFTCWYLLLGELRLIFH